MQKDCNFARARVPTRTIGGEMLRCFHLENWKSFRFPVTLDLVETRE